MNNTRRAFTSDMMRQIYREAVRQGWTPQDGGRSSGHLYVVCPHPDCNYREAFSTTGRCRPPEKAQKLRSMRSHGFLWQGRGGEHTAAPLGRTHDVKKET